MTRLLNRLIASLNQSGLALPNDALRVCDFVGRDVQVKSRPFVVNKGRLSVGARFHISSDPVRSHLVTEPHGSIEIGDDVSIESGSGVASSESIRIGRGTHIGAFVLIMDCDYHVVGDTDAVPATAPVEIGRNVRIGHNSTILRGTTIADNTVIPPGSTIQGQVPAEHPIGTVLPETNQSWPASTDSTCDDRPMVECVRFSDNERGSNDSIQDVAQLLQAITACQSPRKRDARRA